MRQVLITGASSDIGVATCKKYLAEGFKVIGHYNKGQTSVFDLIDDSNKRFVSFIRDDVRVDSKAFAFEDKLIWGASARMIIQISDLIENKVKNG